MFARIAWTALAAGVIAGVFLWALHMLLTTPLILAAEVIEGGGHGAADDIFRRHGLTLLMDVLTGVGFGFLLTGTISLTGRRVDWRRGLAWGLCGFAAFFVAPSLGFAPKLPGMNVATLDVRQLWWLATAAATAVGLGLALLSENPALRAVGLVLIVLPHLFGTSGTPAPAEAGDVPAELAARFVMATTVATGLFWMVLGALSGYFYTRFDQHREAGHG